MTLPVDTIIQGDCRFRLKELPTESVQTVITSPPYFGLRDYGTGEWIGGDASCAHQVGNQVQDNKAHGAIVSGVWPGCDASQCRKCGATRQDAQIGLEPTTDAYVAKLVDVFREVKRILRDDGTLWLNLGDSYGGSGRGPSGYNAQVKHTERQGFTSAPAMYGGSKQLLGVPWRVALALQADGWILRSDIIWVKSNAMPESVRDRPTKTHEYLFLLAKQAHYYYDADAIREPLSPARARQAGHFDGHAWLMNPKGRNKRTVWVIPTRPYTGAHFATFPPALVEPCVLAGSRPGDVVLDPFAGAGTVALVAKQHGRHYLGIELNSAYITLAEQRIAAALSMSTVHRQRILV